MAGLDTRGFVSGAAQGFGLAQNYIDTKRRRDNEDEQLEWQVQDRDTAAQDRRRAMGMQDQRMEWLEQDRDTAAQDRLRAMGMQDQQLEWQAQDRETAAQARETAAQDRRRTIGMKMNRWDGSVRIRRFSLARTHGPSISRTSNPSWPTCRPVGS